MKDDLKKIYGKEWNWFQSLTKSSKIRIVWFVLSFAFTVGINDIHNIPISIIIGLNMVASVFSLNKISGKDLEE
jgi:hypothetical protein